MKGEERLIQFKNLKLIWLLISLLSCQADLRSASIKSQSHSSIPPSNSNEEASTDQSSEENFFEDETEDPGGMSESPDIDLEDGSGNESSGFEGPSIDAPLAIFPYAQGFGTESKAGRGGEIIKVTNLNNSGPGSLRDAVSAKVPRIIVFEVGGVINLTSDIKIEHPFITLAGQSAPNPGITLLGAGIRVTTHDVLIQHLRIRVGDNEEGENPENRDALQILGPSAHNIVIDHMSASWSIDEVMSTWYPVRDITISNSIVSEALHSKKHPKGVHPMGLLIGDNAKRVSLIGNLLAHNAERNPLFKGGVTALMANNLFFNAGRWEFTAIVDSDGSGPSDITAVGNIYLKGPDTTATVALKVGSSAAKGTRLYYNDNHAPNLKEFANSSDFNPVVSAPPIWHDSIQPIESDLVEDYVFQNAGARPAHRDAVDIRIIQETKDRKGGFIESPSDVGGLMEAVSPTHRAFEVPNDPHSDEDQNGFTNIEEKLFQMAIELQTSKNQPE